MGDIKVLHDADDDANDHSLVITIVQLFLRNRQAKNQTLNFAHNDDDLAITIALSLKQTS